MKEGLSKRTHLSVAYICNVSNVVLKRGETTFSKDSCGKRESVREEWAWKGNPTKRKKERKRREEKREEGRKPSSSSSSSYSPFLVLSLSLSPPLI